MAYGCGNALVVVVEARAKQGGVRFSQACALRPWCLRIHVLEFALQLELYGRPRVHGGFPRTQVGGRERKRFFDAKIEIDLPPRAALTQEETATREKILKQIWKILRQGRHRYCQIDPDKGSTVVCHNTYGQD